MDRKNTICPKCGSKKNPKKEKIMGQDTMDLICQDCGHIGWWKDLQPQEQDNKLKDAD